MSTPSRFARQSYHQTSIEFRNCHTLDGCFHGIELELEPADDSRSHTGIVRAMPAHFVEKDGPAPALEVDSSLCAGGVEIIFPPVSPNQLRDDDSYIARTIKAMGSVAKSSTRTGMHFNVNTKGWSAKKIGIFVGTVHHLPAEMLKAIGGRNPGNYCNQMKERCVHDWANDSYKVEQLTVDFYSRQPGPNHVYAAEVRTNRVECRFPAATVDLEKVREISAFLEYLEDWAAPDYANISLTSKPKDFALKFVHWLARHPDQMAKNISEKLYAASPRSRPAPDTAE